MCKGLGKTIQTIAFLGAILGKEGGRSDYLAKKARKMVLIVTPTSVLSNWCVPVSIRIHLITRFGRSFGLIFNHLCLCVCFLLSILVQTLRVFLKCTSPSRSQADRKTLGSFASRRGVNKSEVVKKMMLACAS